jgi:hypothetical protein
MSMIYSPDMSLKEQLLLWILKGLTTKKKKKKKKKEKGFQESGLRVNVQFFEVQSLLLFPFHPWPSLLKL